MGLMRSRLQRVSRRSRQARQQRPYLEKNWYDESARSSDAAIFIGGCGRSGTSLFREILARHPRIACGPETSMFGLPFDLDNLWPRWELAKDDLEEGEKNCANIVEFAEWFYREYLLKGEGKVRWADKTPNNVRAIDRILTWFPEARFIHVIRDGRDVVCSLRHHPKEKYIDGKLVSQDITNSIRDCAIRWLADTSSGLGFQNHPRYLAVRYEELVRHPTATMSCVCNFLGEDFTSEMVDPNTGMSDRLVEGRMMCNENAAKPIFSKSIGRWVNDLSLSERRTFCDIAGELLIALGYASDHQWIDE